jgi:hypothetical protein
MLRWRAGPFSIDTGRQAPPDWFVDDAAPTFRVDVRDAKLDWSDESLRVVSTGAGESVEVRRPGGYEANIDYGTGDVRYRGLFDVVSSHNLCPVFESFLRVLCSGALLRSGGALLHASAVAVRGSAWVFCGVSGAGKTTLVEGTADDEYLTDDQSIVTASESGFMAWGTPFSGSAARRAPPRAHPVAAFVLLDEMRANRTTLVRRRDGGRAAGELLRHVCAHERSVSEARRALDVAARIVATTPVFSLRRHLDTSLAALIDEMSSNIQSDGAKWVAA